MASARSRFGVLVGQVTEIDWLWLHHAGHRRVRLDWLGDQWAATRIAP
jgi:hypothetical protein